jgi:hypothetical protein
MSRSVSSLCAIGARRVTGTVAAHRVANRRTHVPNAQEKIEETAGEMTEKAGEKIKQAGEKFKEASETFEKAGDISSFACSFDFSLTHCPSCP